MAHPSSSQLEILIRRRGDRSVEALPPDRLEELDRLVAEPGTIACVHVTNPSVELIDSLQREFGLHPLAAEDLRKRRQRPKIDAYGDQYMVVAYEATGHGERRRGALSEIHIFLGPAWIVTAHWTAAPMVQSVHERLRSHPESVGPSIGDVLYATLDAAVDSFFPELDRLSDRIDALEDQVLSAEGKSDDLREILAIKRRLLELRRVLAPMRDVVNALLRRETALVDPSTVPYFQDLYDHLVRVLDQLDVYRDLLATVLDARLTVASNSLNAVMKRLTAFTVILMVPTLIAGIYGMNFTLMPELDWPLGYPLALGLMAAAVVTAIVFFRQRRWF